MVANTGHMLSAFARLARKGELVRHVGGLSSAQFLGETRLNFQRALERLFARCNAEPACAAAFPSLAQDFYAVYEELTAKPIRVQLDTATMLTLDGRQFFSGIRRQMERSDLVIRIPLLVRELRRGDRERRRARWLVPVSS
jgi:hypothetical protein